VIANRTCPCLSLGDEVARRASATPTAVLVVAPALNSRLRRWVSDVDDALARAQERLGLAVAALRQRGVVVRGEIGDANPLLAIHDALASFAADEIIVATLPVWKRQPSAEPIEPPRERDEVRTAGRRTRNG